MSYSVRVLLRILCSMLIAFLLLLLCQIPFIDPFWVGMTVVLFIGFSILYRIEELGDLVEAGFWPKKKDGSNTPSEQEDETTSQ